MSGRPSGQKVPPYVAELETHRHRGLDFIFITQNPRLIDVNLRSLIEHHTHYSKTSLGLRRKLEWSTGGAKDPDSRASIREALVSVYRLDKSVYGYYKSAEVHTKIRTKRSKAIYIAPVAILAVGYGVWSTYGFIKDMDKPAQTAVRPSETVPAPAPAPVQAGQYPAATPQPEPKPERPHISAEDFEPRIDGQPHTAPIYDAHNTQIQTMPYPVACVKNADKCTCYTEQATPISGFDKGQCLDFVKFQLTAARRRLVDNEDNLFKITLVSTHSRPKAAGCCTDTRPKPASRFNSQPPEGGWTVTKPRRFPKSQFQLTAARRRLGLS